MIKKLKVKKIFFYICFIIFSLIIVSSHAFVQDVLTEVGTVTLIDGYVEIITDDNAERIRTGTLVTELNEFYVDDDSKLQITFNNGCVIDAEGPAEFKIEQNIIEDGAESKPIIITQISGLLNTNFNNTGDSYVTINTPSIVAGVRGTKFVTMVADDGSSYLGVTEGEVVVSSVLDEQDSADENKIGTDSDEINENMSKTLKLKTYETVIGKNQQVEVEFGETKDFKPAKLGNLDEEKKKFLIEKRKELIEHFPEFAEKMLRSFGKVPKFIKETEKRFGMLIKAAEIMKKEEDKIRKSKLSPEKKKQILEKLRESQKKLFGHGVKFFKDTHYHSHKIMATFKIIDKLPKILEGTKIKETKIYKVLMEVHEKIKTLMITYMKGFKEKTHKFAELLLPPKPKNSGGN